MKAFLRITASLFLITVSSNTQSNINDDFYNTGKIARDGSLEDFDTHQSQLLPQLDEEKWRIKAELLRVDALLYAGEYNHAYHLIYSLGRTIFPALSTFSDNLIWGNTAQTLFDQCLDDPGIHIDAEQEELTSLALDIALRLSRYYLFTDQLNKAMRLESHANCTGFSSRSRFFRLNIYRQLGLICCYLNQHDKAEAYFRSGLSLYHMNETRLELGFLHLDLAELAILQDDTDAANTSLLRASQDINGNSAFGIARAKLIRVILDISHGTVTTATETVIREAESYFNQKSKLFWHGFALKLYGMIHEILHGENDFADDCTRNAEDLAHKKTLPLLARLLRGQDYVEESESASQQSDYASQSMSETDMYEDGNDPDNSSPWNTPPSVASTPARLNRIIIPATPYSSENGDPA